MRKNATPNTAEAPVQRTMLRSRTTMSYAFEAAVQNVIDDLVAERDVPAASVALAQDLCGPLAADKGRKRPSWTVSKRPEKSARKRR